jgi:hypothetical protein
MAHRSGARDENHLEDGTPQRSKARRFLTQFSLGLVVSGVMLPGAIAAATVFLFLLGPYDSQRTAHWNSYVDRTPARSCLYGALFGLAACVLLALLPCRRFTSADSACPGPFDQLRQRFDELTRRLGNARTQADEQRGRGPVAAAPPIESAALCEATAQCERLSEVFRVPSPVGLPWLLGTGYVDLWRRLHAAEATLLFLEPAERVVRSGLDDELRLDGSSIPRSAVLLQRLRTAIVSLSPSAAPYLIESPSPRAGAVEPKPVGPDAEQPATARAALAQVRYAISDYRDGLREALVRARNRLFGTIVFSGLTACTLLFVAILYGAPKSAILAATAFYLVGGIVGLVRELQSAATGATATQDDYGLGVVRLIGTPLLAGLAAIGGVVLVRLSQGTTAAFSLADTFNLNSNPYGLVAAAFFGLTPSLLLSSLRQRTDQFRTDLSEAEPHGYRSATRPAG